MLFNHHPYPTEDWLIIEHYVTRDLRFLVLFFQCGCVCKYYNDIEEARMNTDPIFPCSIHESGHDFNFGRAVMDPICYTFATGESPRYWDSEHLAQVLRNFKHIDLQKDLSTGEISDIIKAF